MSYWRSLFDYLLHRKERLANDRSAHLDLQLSSETSHLPKGLEIEWLGTSGFRLTYEGSTILVDPYLTRPGLFRVASGRRLVPDENLLERYVHAADAVLVGHTHFDHALDVPLVTQRFGCKAYGSKSLAALFQGLGRPEEAVAVEPHRVYEQGPFRFSFVPSLHSKLILGRRIPYDYEISCEHAEHLGARGYGCGQVFGIRIEVAGKILYHQGSCDLIDDEIPRGSVDALLAGIAGRGFTERYLERLFARVDPKLVIPHHYDDFFRPLDQDISFSLNVNLSSFIEEARRVSRDVEIGTLEPTRPLVIGQASRS
ncbi:MAG: MBL fold metallo-hydrolase [Myxococcales bacterium]|nr:MBL fold metallo-hydrolase [Myxococcales bacterium]